MDTHLILHATQLKQLTQTKTHSLNVLNTYSDCPRNMKATIFHNNEHVKITISKPAMTPEKCSKTYLHYHHLTREKISVLEKITKLPTPHPMTFIYQKKILPSHMHTKLPQLRANKSPLLQAYLHTANSETYMPHCLTHTHDTNTSLTVVIYQQNTTPLVCGKSF